MSFDDGWVVALSVGGQLPGVQMTTGSSRLATAARAALTAAWSAATAASSDATGDVEQLVSRRPASHAGTAAASARHRLGRVIARRIPQTRPPEGSAARTRATTRFASGGRGVR